MVYNLLAPPTIFTKILAANGGGGWSTPSLFNLMPSTWNIILCWRL